MVVLDINLDWHKGDEAGAGDARYFHDGRMTWEKLWRREKPFVDWRRRSNPIERQRKKRSKLLCATSPTTQAPAGLIGWFVRTGNQISLFGSSKRPSLVWHLGSSDAGLDGCDAKSTPILVLVVPPTVGSAMLLHARGRCNGADVFA